jgi:hypothetical protein
MLDNVVGDGMMAVGTMEESEDGGESSVGTIGGTAGERLGSTSSGRKATTTGQRQHRARAITFAHIR